MWARLSRFAGLSPERIEETIEQFKAEALPMLESQPGFGGVIVAVEHAGGKAMAVSLWDTKEHLRASADVSRQARETAMETSGGRSREPVEDDYEIVVSRMPVAAG